MLTTMYQHIITAEEWAANPQPVETKRIPGRPLPEATPELRAQFESLQALSQQAGHILSMGSWPNTLYSPLILWSCPCNRYSDHALPWYPDSTGDGFTRLRRFLEAAAQDESNPIRNGFYYG